MSDLNICARSTATVSAAFFATMSGYVYIDTVIARERAMAESLASAPRAIVKLQSTAGLLDFCIPLQRSSYPLSDCLPGARTRSVTRTEDLILRGATLRAGRVISKGRFARK